MFPPQFFYHFVLCALSYLFAEINPTSLKLFPGNGTGFYTAKNPLPWCKPVLFDSDCSCHKAQCNHTEETCMRRHVVMINQSRVRRAGENWCRPTRDCQGSGYRWVQALTAVRARELSANSPDRLTNQHSLPPHQQITVFLSFSLLTHYTSPDKYKYAQEEYAEEDILYLFNCLTIWMIWTIAFDPIRTPCKHNSFLHLSFETFNIVKNLRCLFNTGSTRIWSILQAFSDNVDWFVQSV